MTLRFFSFGGGVQSVAALVLAAQGRIDFQTFVFSNVGDDSENPETLSYFQSIATPFAEQNGLALHEVRKLKRGGGNDSLLDNVLRTKRSIPIPVRVQNGAPGRRNCTSTFKIKVIAKWLKSYGASAKAPAVLGMGISLDEFQRMRNNSGFDHYTLEYPLIDLKLRRQDCEDIITEAGLPIPPKSSCWFCPFHKVHEWQDMKRDHPDLFEKSVELEHVLNRRREELGRDEVYFSSRCKPLAEAVNDNSPVEERPCDSGFCFV